MKVWAYAFVDTENPGPRGVVQLEVRARRLGLVLQSEYFCSERMGGSQMTPGWIGDARAPVRAEIDPETYEKLSAVLTLLLGIDPSPS